MVKKGISLITGLWISLKNKEKTYIMKVIESLENWVILFKGTTRKIASQVEGFLNFLKPLMTAGLLLIKNVLNPLAKIASIPLGLTAAATNAAIQNKIYGSGKTVLIIHNRINNRITFKIIKNEKEEQRGRFSLMLLRTLPARTLGNTLSQRAVIMAGEGVIRAGYLFCSASFVN